MSDPLDAFRRQGEIDAAKPLPVPINWKDRAEKAERERDELREALIKARQFIENGIELGFINLPEDKGDPSHDTLPAIRAALEAKP